LHRSGLPRPFYKTISVICGKAPLRGRRAPLVFSLIFTSDLCRAENGFVLSLAQLELASPVVFAAEARECGFNNDLQRNPALIVVPLLLYHTNK
jgi:hypothetical protein